MNKQTFVIVGAGLAGAKAAQELRDRGFDGRVVLIGAESERPCERPPLSKDYLRGEAEREKTYVHPEAWCAEHEVELEPGIAVSAIDTGSSRVLLEDNRELAYDALLLTTGAEPRRLRVPGAELDGIYYLRTLRDCDALRARLDAGGRVAMVGAGWIGSEFAASASQRERLVSSVPNIYAAGDVANAWHPFYERRIRVAHWANALNQGPAAARSMLGNDASYERIPYFFSDQYDVGMEYSGYAEGWDEVVLRGDPDAGEGFVAFWLRDGRVVAGMNVNVWDGNQDVQELIRSRRPADPAALADPAAPLPSLLALSER